MDSNDPIQVRGRCACGRRYRILHARSDTVVLCPNCRRVIRLTDTDLQAAAADERLVPLQGETDELVEVIPVVHGALRLAPEGSQPGLTGATILSHEEAALAYSMRGIKLTDSYERAVMLGPGVNRRSNLAPQRSFLGDWLAGFYCDGELRDALFILALAAIGAIPALVRALFALPRVLEFGGIMLELLVLVYAVRFYWAVLQRTATNDFMLRAAEGRTLRRGWLSPVLLTGLISLLCSLPYIVVAHMNLITLPGDPRLSWLLLGLGWLFWPAAIVSVAFGRSPIRLRPDRVLLTVFGFGPAYLAACLTVLLWLASWYSVARTPQPWQWYPAAEFAVSAYLGYLAFRTCGLLFRHYHRRFPWLV